MDKNQCMTFVLHSLLAMQQTHNLTMFRRMRENAFFADTQKFFPATAICDTSP